jgi:hypothetical protein
MSAVAYGRFGPVNRAAHSTAGVCFPCVHSSTGHPVRGGRMDENAKSVHSTVDPLNSYGVAADHLA